MEGSGPGLRCRQRGRCAVWGEAMRCVAVGEGGSRLSLGFDLGLGDILRWLGLLAAKVRVSGLGVRIGFWLRGLGLRNWFGLGLNGLRFWALMG